MVSIQTLPKPTDEKSATETLKYFMDNALNKTLKNTFLKAVEILYGPSYTIRESISHRMVFYCTVCKKEVNNIVAVAQHAQSGTHIKNEDEKLQDSKNVKEPSNTYHRKSLRFKISNSAVPIIGCQMVEEYDQGKGIVGMYYKCILCGAHGKLDAMYKHLIGDKHTDRYIRSRIELRNPAVSSEERLKFKKILFNKENYTARNIITIKGYRYYPYKWEDEGRPSKFRNEQSPVVSRLSPDIVKVKEESDDNIEVDDDNGEIKIEKGTKVDKMTQCISYGFLNQIFLKFNVIVQLHLNPETDIKCAADLKMGLNLVNYSLHLLYFANRELLAEVHVEEAEMRLNAQKKSISSCLGYVYSRLLPYYKAKYGDWHYESSFYKILQDEDSCRS